MLQHDTIAIRILERSTHAIPVRIERRYRLIARGDHAVDGPAPLALVGQIEHQQVVGGRRAARDVTALAGEFQMIGGARLAQNHAVESTMVLERTERLQTEPLDVDPHPLVEPVGGARNSQSSLYLHGPLMCAVIGISRSGTD